MSGNVMQHCAGIGQNSLDSVYTHEDNDTFVDLTASLSVTNAAAVSQPLDLHGHFLCMLSPCSPCI